MAFWNRNKPDLFAANAKLEQQRLTTAKVLDDALGRMKAGQQLSGEDHVRCGKVMARYYEVLSSHYKKAKEVEFGEEDRVNYYVEAIKLAAMNHADHFYWPHRSELRKTVLPGLKRRLSASEDPWLCFVSVVPAIIAGDLTMARVAYHTCKHEHLYKWLSYAWVSDLVESWSSHNNVEYARAFLSAIANEVVAPLQSEALTQEEYWAICASPLTSFAMDPRTTLADSRGEGFNQFQLADHWRIIDAATAEATLECLAAGMHNRELAKLLGGGNAFVARHEPALRRYGIVAWDACRQITTARAALAAKYISRERAQDFILNGAERLRKTYPSWQAMGEDVELGFRFQYQFSDSDSEERLVTRLIRHFLKDSQSPWRLLPWDANAAQSSVN